MPRNLRSHIFRLIPGIITNLSADKRAGIGLTAGDNVDGFERFGSLGKVPGSTRRSDDHGSAVVSLHQFEFTDLAFARQRKQLSLANGVLYDIDPSTLAITSIQTGLATEALTAVTMLNRIHLSSPNQRNLATGGIKYDGTNVRNWGVNAPGTQETVVQALDSAANWTASTDATSSTNTSITQDNVAGVQMDKTGTTVTEGYIQRTGQSDDISATGSDTLFIWFFVPAGALQNFATSGTAVQIRFGDSSLTNSDSHNFSVGELLPGWNQISMVLTAPDATTGTGAALGSIDTWRFRVVLSAAATVQSGFVWDKLFFQDEGAPTPADADTTTGGTAGSYVYRVTYLTESGVESNAGAAATSVTTSGIKATTTLDQTGQPSDTETVTIDTKTYTFQTTLTDVDGNVFIGADANTTLANLVAAINLGAGAGSAYATSTTEHATVDASVVANDALLTAVNKGTAANAFVTTETATNYAFTSTTAFSGGAATNAVTLTAIPTSTDPQVIARRIFRDISADAVYRFVAQIDDNVTTTFTDTIADASLGTAQPPLSGDAFIDSTPPGRLLATVIHNKRVVGIAADARDTLVFSDINQPETFRIIEQITLEEELVALGSHVFGTIIYGTDTIFLMTGDGIRTPLFIEKVSGEIGANGFRSVIRVKGNNMVVREEQIFLISNPHDPWFISGAIQDTLLSNLTNSTLSDAHIAHDRSRFRMVLFAKGSSGNYDQIHVYQYGTLGGSEVSASGSGIDPLDLRNGAWFTMSLPSGVNPQSSAMVERTADKPELWVGGNDGFVYFLQDTSVTTYANGLSTAAVNASFTTAAVPLSATGTGRGEPRFLRINATTTTSTVVAVVVRLLSDANGAVINSNSFNLTLANGSNSIIAPIPAGGRRGAWVNVQITNNVAADSLVIDSLELQYIPRGAFRGPRTA